MNELLNGIVKGIVDTKARAHGRVQIKKSVKRKILKAAWNAPGSKKKMDRTGRGPGGRGKGLSFLEERNRRGRQLRGTAEPCSGGQH